MRFYYGHDQLISFDGCGYIMHAQSLAQGKITTPYWAKGIDHYFPPLYPFIILIFNAVTGDWILSAKLASWVFAALFLIPVYLIAAKLGNREAGVLAAALAVCYPLLVDNSANAASEPPFLFFLGMAVYFLLPVLQKPDWRKSFPSGIMLGLAYLTRYQGYSSFINVVLILLFFTLVLKKLPLGKGLRQIAMVALGFFILAAPYDGYCLRKQGSLMLRPRQEFFKKEARFRQGFDWYRNERYLDAEAKELMNLKRGRVQPPVQYIMENSSPYLKSVALAMGEFFIWGVGEQAVIPILILCLCLAFLDRLILEPEARANSRGHLFLALWLLTSMFAVILFSSDIDRYYSPMLVALLVWAGLGAEYLKSMATALPGRWKFLASNRSLVIWILPLLILFPRERLRLAYDQKDKADKMRHTRALVDWSRKKIDSPKKIVMSTDPAVAMLTGNYWYMLPLDYPERVKIYAREQAADYLLVEDSIFSWLEMPPDWFDYFKFSEDISGWNFVGAYGDTGGGKSREARLYKVDRVEKEKPPNIILLVIDSLRPDHLGSYGYAQNTSPNLDALAAKGARFSRAISQSWTTTGSLMSIFTSLYPEVHVTSSESKNSPHQLGDKFTTLPEVLKNAGYRTAGFFGQADFNPSAGFGRGMELWAQNTDTLDRESLLRASQWIESAQALPFFMFIHAGPRNLYSPPPADTWDYWLGRKEQLVALYDMDIKNIDKALGDFFYELKKKGSLDNTLVIVTSDHGREFWEHNNFSHNTLYAENSHVPLILIWPGRVPEGLVIDSQVRLIDLMPTIIDFAGVSMPGQVQGASLRPLISGKNESGLFAAGDVMCEDNRWYALEYGLRYKGWFYYYRRDPKNPGARAGEEFFHESDDPLDLKDLMAQEESTPGLLKEKKRIQKLLHNQLWMHSTQNQRMSRLLREKNPRVGPREKK